MMLVSLEEAKKHIRVDHDDEDAEITLYLKAASAAVINYLKTYAERYFDSNSDIIEDSNGIVSDVGFEVQAATLLMVGYLYRLRDDNDNSSFRASFEFGQLPIPVISLLYPLRDPAFV